MCLARTVAEKEAQYYIDSNGDQQLCNLKSDIDANEVTVFDVQASDIRAFRSQFDLNYFDRLDPGESESLAYLMHSQDTCLICSGDSIVYRVLGNAQKGDRGISLQEVLDAIGLSRQLNWWFTKAFREEWTKKGFADHIGGTGLKT